MHCYCQASAFLKQQSVGHRPKKSKVFTLEEMERFLDTASNDKYLLQKVMFIVGVGELVAKEYTAHSFRRSSATLPADSVAASTVVK